ASHAQEAGNAQVPARDLDEHRIALRRPHRREVADHPKPDADEPEPQAEPERGGERAVEDGDRARRAAEEDVLGQRPVNRHREAGDLGGIKHTSHYTTAPPPKLKKLRKKELAANAIDRPNTICTSLRKPPLVSP